MATFSIPEATAFNADLPFSSTSMMAIEVPSEGNLPLRVLSDLAVGEGGIVERLDLPEGVQQHLMHMGFVPGARVIASGRAPAGDPTVYAIDGLDIALRRETARAIHVRPIPAVALRQARE